MKITSGGFLYSVPFDLGLVCKDKTSFIVEYWLILNVNVGPRGVRAILKFVPTLVCENIKKCVTP